NPLDPLLPRADWFVSAAAGDDGPTALQGGGTETTPWFSINRAMEQLAPLPRENFPITVWLDGTPTTIQGNALYTVVPFTLLPFTTLGQSTPEEGVFAKITPISTGSGPV